MDGKFYSGSKVVSATAPRNTPTKIVIYNAEEVINMFGRSPNASRDVFLAMNADSSQDNVISVSGYLGHDGTAGVILISSTDINNYQFRFNWLALTR